MKPIFKKIIVSILTWEAKLVLKKYSPKIVAITGSVGKTSTKDAIRTVLSHFFYVRESDKSFNSELGVPLTILGCPTGWNSPYIWLKNIIEGAILIILPAHYPDWLVLEIGADRPGDIEKITRWIKPDIAVITRLSKVPVHIEFFPTASHVINEKSYLARALKRDGTLILDGDDEDVRAFSTLVESRTLFYGLKNADILASHYKITYEKGEPVGITFIAAMGDKTEEVSLDNSLGLQQVYPALAAIAVGSTLGLALNKMAKVLSKHISPPGRMRILKGVKDTTIIDDTYNSSPVALSEALKTLKQIKTKGKKIAVLGDMLELGIYSHEEHKKAGAHVRDVADILITCGLRARGIAEGALNHEMPESNIFQFEDSQKAGKYLEEIIKIGDTALIKGSQGVRMERAVEEVMLNPMEKTKLLVRQDEEWQNR